MAQWEPEKLGSAHQPRQTQRVAAGSPFARGGLVGGTYAPRSPLADVLQRNAITWGGLACNFEPGGSLQFADGLLESSLLCALGASHAPKLRWKRTTPGYHTCKYSQGSSFSLNTDGFVSSASFKSRLRAAAYRERNGCHPHV